MQETVYYHGSSHYLDSGTVMTGRGEGYEADWKHTDFYLILERYRPVDSLPHKQAVFMVDNVDDIDNAGGGTDWVFELSPQGPISRHDVNWCSEISRLLSDGFSTDSPEVKAAAENYWSGKPHNDESVWEYLVESATVLKSYEYDDAPSQDFLSIFKP